MYKSGLITCSVTALETHADAATESLSWLHELRELLRQYRITSLQVTLSLCANQNARLPKALGEFLQVYTTSRSKLSYQPVITADIGRADWPALVQIRAINVPVGFYCSRNVLVVFYLTHVGNAASMSPVEFSKRPMSAVANYPFHTPNILISYKVYRLHIDLW